MDNVQATTTDCDSQRPMKQPEPLQRFPLVHTQDPEQLRLVLVENFGIRHFDLPAGHQGFWVRSNHAKLGNTGILYCAVGTGFEVEITDEENVWYLHCLSGHADVSVGRRRIRLAPDSPCVANANVQLTWHYGSHEKIALRLSAKALAEKMRALTGTRPARELQFEPSLDAATPEGKGLRRMIGYLVDELDACGSPSSIAVVELEQLLMTFFLLASRHNFSDLAASRPKPIAPWQVRRAEEYIEANWNKPLTIEALASVTNASVRSLFERFRDYRGVSPMTFARQVRLTHARKMLLVPEASTSVTGVALLCGFMNTGHFARHYRHAFGELPSETLFRSRSVLIIS